MSDKRMVWVVLAGLSLCLKVCVLANKSSRSNSYSSYSSSYDKYGLKKSSYDPYGLNSQAQKDQLNLSALRRELKKELENGVQRNCSVVRSSLRLELDVTEPGVAALNREVARATLPSGSWLPAPLVSQGLSVSVKDGSGDAARLCLDADEALLKDVVAMARPSAEPVKLGAGAWSVTTTDLTATTALLSASVLEGFKVKGQLIAFAPTDQLVVFADSANAAAIAQAAKYAAEHTTTSADDGCVAIEPLVRAHGTWGTWLPNGKPSTAREVEAARTAARECQANLVDNLLETLVALRQAGMSGVPFVDTFDASERTFTPKQTTVTLALDDSSTPQLLSPAQQVKLETDDGRELTMSWETFVGLGGTRVAPVIVKGTTVPNAFFFEGGLAATDFAGKKGVTSKKQQL